MRAQDPCKVYGSLRLHLQPVLSRYLPCFRHLNSFLNLTKASQWRNFYPSYMKRRLRKLTGISIKVSAPGVTRPKDPLSSHSGYRVQFEVWALESDPGPQSDPSSGCDLSGQVSDPFSSPG